MGIVIHGMKNHGAESQFNEWGMDYIAPPQLHFWK